MKRTTTRPRTSSGRKVAGPMTSVRPRTRPEANSKKTTKTTSPPKTSPRPRTRPSVEGGGKAVPTTRVKSRTTYLSGNARRTDNTGVDPKVRQAHVDRITAMQEQAAKDKRNINPRAATDTPPSRGRMSKSTERDLKWNNAKAWAREISSAARKLVTNSGKSSGGRTTKLRGPNTYK